MFGHFATLRMYDFHYNEVFGKYENHAKLLFTDIESLFIAHKMSMKTFGRTKKSFGPSVHPKDLEYYDLKNRKVIR